MGLDALQHPHALRVCGKLKTHGQTCAVGRTKIVDRKPSVSADELV
jgi:hypothetical protein